MKIFWFTTKIRKRIVYVGRQVITANLVPFDQWNQLIESKSKLPLLEKRSQLQGHSFTLPKITSETQNALRSSGKVIDGLYFHREEIESGLQITWQRTSFPISIVLAKSGGGRLAYSTT